MICNKISVSLNAVVCLEVFTRCKSDFFRAQAGKFTGDICKLNMKFSSRSVLDSFDESVGGEIFTYSSPSIRCIAVNTIPVVSESSLSAEANVEI